jgi:hypothetical protein
VWRSLKDALQASGSPQRVSGQEQSVNDSRNHSNHDTVAKGPPRNVDKGRPRKQDRTANLAGSLPGMESAPDEHEKHSAGRSPSSQELSEAAIEFDYLDGDSCEAAAQHDGGELVPGSSPESRLPGPGALPTVADRDGDGSTAAQDGDRCASASNSVRTPLANVGGGGRVQTENAVRDFRRGCSMPLSRGIETGAAGSRFINSPPRGTDQSFSPQQCKGKVGSSDDNWRTMGRSDPAG